MHLAAAEQMRQRFRDSREVSRQFGRHFPAFYLGNVAPDYQTICNVPRERTHFYRLPPTADERPQRVFLDRHPELADAVVLAGDQACFLAGYCAHLIMDYRWYSDILIPYFVDSNGWRDHRQRFVVHNALLTYLDGLAVDALPNNAHELLAAAQPKGWLPFASDEELERWQRLLVEQLRPGQPVQTTSIFAQRLQMAPEAFEARLADRQWMNENLFDRLPMGRIQALVDEAADEGGSFVKRYLEGA